MRPNRSSSCQYFKSFLCGPQQIKKKDMSLLIIFFHLLTVLQQKIFPSVTPQGSLLFPHTSCSMLNPWWQKPRLCKSLTDGLASLLSNDELLTCNVCWSKWQSVSTGPKAPWWGNACLYSYCMKGTKRPVRPAEAFTMTRLSLTATTLWSSVTASCITGKVSSSNSLMCIN